MAYITIDEYEAQYGEVPSGFERLAFRASRIMDDETTGVDGVKKLKEAFPIDPDDEQAVKMCAAALVTFLAQVERLQAANLEAGEYTRRADGSLVGKVITSVSSGSESISYSSQGAGAASSVSAAVADESERKRMCSHIVREYLAGICDANGVHLLYMGAYPYVR